MEHIEKLKKHLIQKYGETCAEAIEEGIHYAFGLGFDYGRLRQDTQKKIAQIDPKTGKIVRVWNGLKKASKETGASRAHIRNVANGKRNTARGYSWKYA